MPALSGSRKCLLVNRLQMRRWEMQRQLTQVCWLKNMGVHGMGPKRELMGRAFRMAGLLWFQGKCGAKEHPHTCRCKIYREGYQNEVLVMMLTVSSQLHTPSTGGSIRCNLRH